MGDADADDADAERVATHVANIVIRSTLIMQVSVYRS